MKVTILMYKTILVTFFLLLSVKAFARITVQVVDVNDMPLSGLVVYLLPLDNQKLSNTPQLPDVVNQTNKKFSPYIVVVRKGMPITFKNLDDITHQIYSALSKNRFSFTIQHNTKKTIKPVAVVGKVLMACNIHDWMSGYLLVVDTPYYSKTNSDGKSILSVVEPGRYQLRVWHPQLQENQSEIIRDINIRDSSNYLIKLTNEMAKIPNQENPGGYDYLEDY